MIKHFYKILLICLFVVIGISSKAQTNYAEVDSNSYKLYYNMQWKRLIYFGENAINDSVDYMFLRQRIGIAYFSLKNYRMAAYHLEKALAFNCDDDFTLYYLYYSYLYSGRLSDANYLTRNMTQTMKDSLHWRNKYISSIDVEGGVSKSNNISKNSTINIDGTADIYGENDMCGDLSYNHIGLNHEVLPFLSIYQSINNINIANEKEIRYNKNITHAKDSTVDTICNYTVKQFEYYISGDIQLMEGLKITPAYHYLHVGFTKLNTNLDQNKHLEIISTTSSLNNYVVSLAITKEFKLTSLSLFASKSNLNALKQTVFGATFNYFPFGNTNFYTSTTISYILEDSNINGNPKRYILDQIAGVKILKKLWGEASITLGDLTDFNEKNAFIVYNTFDNIKLKAGLSLIYTLSPHFDLSLRYQFLQRQDAYMTYISTNQKIYTTTNYLNNTIIGGIKWKL